MITSWFINFLSKDIVDSVIYCRTAKDLWVSLEHKFGKSNGEKLFHMKKNSIDQYKELTILQGISQSLRDYGICYLFLIHMINELCCICKGKHKLKKSMEDEMLMRFLMVLNDTYV